MQAIDKKYTHLTLIILSFMILSQCGKGLQGLLESQNNENTGLHGQPGNNDNITIDHFNIDTIPSQTAGQTFTVVISAMDKSGSKVTNYTRSAAISDITGTIEPATTGEFTNGEWTGGITIYEALSENTITVTEGSFSGNSSSFNVNPGPLHHFDISNIPASQTAGREFSATISAYDEWDNKITSFTDTVSLTASSGSINPQTTGQFSEGEWTGNVTIYSAGSNISFTAAGPGKNGISNQFNVVTGPLHHFKFSDISAQNTGQSFSITITAEDEWDNTVTGYTGIVSLSDTTGTITPLASGAFMSGEWTGSVNIDKTQNSVIITATDSVAGTSSPFDVNLQWYLPSSIDDYTSPTGNHVLGDTPRVAVSGNGDAIVIWAQRDSTNDIQIFCSEKRNGVWTHPADINDNISDDGTDALTGPVVNMDNNGNALVAWLQNDGSDDMVYIKHFYSDTWSNTVKISLFGTGNAGNHRISIGDNGHAIVVWTRSDGINDNVYKMEFRGSGWTMPQKLNIDNNNHCLTPDVKMADNGETVVVWAQDDGGQTRIHRRHYRDGSWRAAAAISSTASASSEPVLDINTGGDIIIVWKQDRAAVNHLYKARYQRSTDYWSPEPDVTTDNISLTGIEILNEYRCAVNDNGDIAIAWQQTDGSYQQVFKAEYRNSSWTTPSSQSDNVSINGSDVSNKQLCIDNGGNINVAWQQSDGMTEQVYKARYTDTNWIIPGDFSADVVSTPGFGISSLTMDTSKSGDIVILWQQSDGSNNQIFTRYNFNSTWSVSAEKISFDGYDSDYIDAKYDDANKAVIAWRQSAPDGYKHVYIAEIR